MNKREYVAEMERHKKCLYRVAYSYMNDKTLALDALDEAFYKGYINRGKLKNEECFKTWLTRIVVNECLQLLRKKKREVLTQEIPGEQEVNGYTLQLPYVIADQKRMVLFFQLPEGSIDEYGVPIYDISIDDNTLNSLDIISVSYRWDLEIEEGGYVVFDPKNKEKIDSKGFLAISIRANII